MRGKDRMSWSEGTDVRRDQMIWHEIRWQVRSACFMMLRATVVARRSRSWPATAQQDGAKQARTAHGACKFYGWKRSYNQI